MQEVKNKEVFLIALSGLLFYLFYIERRKRKFISLACKEFAREAGFDIEMENFKITFNQNIE